MTVLEPEAVTTLPPVTAELREKDGLALYVDPIAVRALREAKRAGGTPAGFGALPDLDEVPLRIVALEARVERLEGILAYAPGGNTSR